MPTWMNGHEVEPTKWVRLITAPLGLLAFPSIKKRSPESDQLSRAVLHDGAKCKRSDIGFASTNDISFFTSVDGLAGPTFPGSLEGMGDKCRRVCLDV